MNDQIETNNMTVLGQKYAFATISLVLGISCFVNLLGLEKAILAIVFGWMALRADPPPALVTHRLWAKAGIVLGILPLVLLPTILILNFDRVKEILDVFVKMSGGR
jgi:hypothetical protein